MAMMIQFYPSEEIEKIRSTSVWSGKRIAPDVKVDYVTSKHIGFSCYDPKFNTVHSVIYFSEKKFPNSWNCDCKWHSLKNKFCKHILAVFFRLNEDQNFLKKFQKEKVNLYP
jgi:hypothetical protein